MKRQAKGERMRRLLAVVYEKLLEGADTHFTAKNSRLLDAIKDCIEDNVDGMREWYITADGDIDFE